MMEWYEEAADKFIEFLDKETQGSEIEMPVIKSLQEEDVRFHFDAGMIIRNDLRNLGFTDDKHGNLDDHYLEILKICYEKVGI
jgi:hypothetical protein